MNQNNISRGSVNIPKDPIHILDPKDMSFQGGSYKTWIPEDLIEYGKHLTTDEEYEAYRLMMLTRLHTLN